MRIEHVAMYVNDIEKARDFLSDILTGNLIPVITM